VSEKSQGGLLGRASWGYAGPFRSHLLPFSHLRSSPWSPTLTLLRHALMVFPVVMGSGKRLFEDNIETTVLRLVETKTFGSGVVLSYRPTVEAAEG
jgi:hypothetical protein